MRALLLMHQYTVKLQPSDTYWWVETEINRNTLDDNLATSINISKPMSIRPIGKDSHQNCKPPKCPALGV